MILRRSSYTLLARIIATAYLLSFPSALCATELKEKYVQVAILLVSSTDPLIGAATCESNRHCMIISRPDFGITASVELHYNDDAETGRLVIDCRLPCSFQTGKRWIDFRDQRIFDLFEGEYIGVEIELVHLPRTKIGEVSLIITPDVAASRAPI